MIETSNSEAYTQYYAKPKLNDDKDIYFILKRKDGNEYVEEEQRPNKLGGELNGIFWNEFDYNGSVLSSISVQLIDKTNKEQINVQFGLGSFIGKSVVNAILNTRRGQYIEFIVYKNKEGYNSISIKGNDNENINWKFPYDELPKVEITKNKAGKVVDKDDSEVVALFKGHIEQFIEDTFRSATEEVKEEKTFTPENAQGFHKDKQEKEEISIEEVPFS